MRRFDRDEIELELGTIGRYCADGKCAVRDEIEAGPSAPDLDGYLRRTERVVEIEHDRVGELRCARRRFHLEMHGKQCLRGP